LREKPYDIITITKDRERGKYHSKLLFLVEGFLVFFFGSPPIVFEMIIFWYILRAVVLLSLSSNMANKEAQSDSNAPLATD